MNPSWNVNKTLSDEVRTGPGPATTAGNGIPTSETYAFGDPYDSACSATADRRFASARGELYGTQQHQYGAPERVQFRGGPAQPGPLFRRVGEDPGRPPERFGIDRLVGGTYHER